MAEEFQVHGEETAVVENVDTHELIVEDQAVQNFGSVAKHENVIRE